MQVVVVDSSGLTPILVDSRQSLEAAEALETEAEGSTAHAMLVYDDAAACLSDVSVATRRSGVKNSVPACLPPKPLVHIKPIFNLFCLGWLCAWCKWNVC